MRFLWREIFHSVPGIKLLQYWPDIVVPYCACARARAHHGTSGQETEEVGQG